MNKFGYFLVGAGAGLAGVAVVDAIFLGDLFYHLKLSNNTNGPYRLVLMAYPKVAKTGLPTTFEVVVTKDGKPMVMQPVTLKVGSQSYSLTTDSNGTATATIVHFKPQTSTVTATYVCPCGKTIVDSASVSWRGAAVVASA